MADQESGSKGGGIGGILGSVSSIAGHLKDIDYPKKKDEIIQFARQKGVPGQLLDKLNGVSDRVYHSAEDVMRELKL